MADAKTEKQKVKEITDKLEEGLKELFESEKYKSYLSTMSKFHNYSFNNTLLISLQKPDASLVCGYRAWQKNFNRHVKKGEKAIRILAPAPYKIKEERDKLDPVTGEMVFDENGMPQTEEVEVKIPAFRAVSVFDVSQTDGEPLPELEAKELLSTVEGYEDFIKAVTYVAPVPIAFEDIPGDSKGYFNTAENRIAVQEGMSESQTLKTMIHETAHSMLHNKEVNADILAPAKDRNTKEVEAESIAFTVCNHFGIDTSEYSFSYIAGWSSGRDMKELKSSLDTIRRTASELIMGIEGQLQELQRDREMMQDKSINGLEKESLLLVQNSDLSEYSLVSVRGMDAAEVVEALSDMNGDDRLSVAAYLESRGAWTTETANQDTEELGERHIDVRYNTDTNEITDMKAETALNESAKEFIGEDDALPDLEISIPEMHEYGYTWEEMLPLTKETALELFERGLTVYQLHMDGSETLVQGEEQITEYDGIFGVEKKDWEKHKETEEQKKKEPEKTYQEVEVFGIPALFDNARIPQEDVPEWLHRYDLRGSDYDPGYPITVEYSVAVNHAASILMSLPLPIPEQGFLRLGEELNFVGGDITVREFEEKHRGMDLDSLLENMDDAICHANEELFLTPSSGYGRYAIYQLNEDAVKDNYLFRNFEYVKSKGIEVRGEDYTLVYGGRLMGDTTLEMLYEKFNLSRPEGFRGHSLSVSDVVVTNRGGEVKAHYVDSFGFAELPEFVKQRQELSEPDMEEQMTALIVEGHIGTWHSIDSVELGGEKFFLMESDDYGELLTHFAVNAEGEVVAEDLEHGFDEGFHEAVAEYFREKDVAYGQETELSPENAPHGEDSARYPAVYPHTAGYAAEHGELELFRDSHNLNIACKKAIEESVRENFDGMHLNPDAVMSVLEEYGAERMAYVLSVTLQQEMWDGRFSMGNKEWAAQAYIPENTDAWRDINSDLVVSSHPAVLDGFIDSFREELRRREKSAELEPGQEKTEQSVKDEPGQRAVEAEPEQKEMKRSGESEPEPSAAEPEPEKKETEPSGMDKPEQPVKDEPGQNKPEQSVKEEPEQPAAEPEWEDGDELIDLGDEREQVLAEMKKSFADERETELAFRIADRYISIQETDGGYDYSIMGMDCREIDGGVYDNPDISIREALDSIIEDLRENPFDNGAAGNIREGSELIPVDYEELVEKVEEANRIVPPADVVAGFKARTDELFHEISDMNPSEIEETVKCHVQAKIEEAGINAEIVDVAVSGSRCRGFEVL